MTEETNKQQIRSNLLLEYAVDQAISKELTDEAYKKAFETYTPEITANVIKLDSEEKANEVLASVKAEGADFAANCQRKLYRCLAPKIRVEKLPLTLEQQLFQPVSR